MELALLARSALPSRSSYTHACAWWISSVYLTLTWASLKGSASNSYISRACLACISADGITCGRLSGFSLLSLCASS